MHTRSLTHARVPQPRGSLVALGLVLPGRCDMRRALC